MSAWLELVESWQFQNDQKYDFAEWLDLCSRAMVEIQTEQRLRDARRACPNGNNSMGPHGHTPNGDGEMVCTP